MHDIPRGAGCRAGKPPVRGLFHLQEDVPVIQTLAQVIDYLVSIVVMLVIVQFVMSLLISFNVVNMRNQFVEALWRAVNALLDPILTPIRRIMPNTGMIDFSPMVLIILLTILRIILEGVARGA
jgi:YggT family protein